MSRQSSSSTVPTAIAPAGSPPSASSPTKRSGRAPRRSRGPSRRGSCPRGSRNPDTASLSGLAASANVRSTPFSSGCAAAPSKVIGPRCRNRPAFNDGWRLGQPDLVVTMAEPYVLPATGRDVLRNFVVPVPVATVRYVRGIEFRPGNSRVVHHANMRDRSHGRGAACRRGRS